MSSVTPRRSLRIPHVHVHTPKTADRKKGLDFTKDSMRNHRLPVVESESDGEGCDLGIISALDTSSSDETTESNNVESRFTCITRSHTKRLLKQTGDLKDFIKSPYTLRDYKTRMSKPNQNTSTPCTPHIVHSPCTPSSCHSATSSLNSAASHSRARKSLADLIADTESCSSSLKDLNFDSESGTESKENTPRRSRRIKRETPNFLSFNGVLKEQRLFENRFNSPITSECSVVLKKTDVFSPSQMMRTPESSDITMSPPKVHGRRVNILVEESPTESANKRSRSDSSSDCGPSSKNPRLETNECLPKARVSLFDEKLRQILSAKSFYSHTVELNTSLVTKINKTVASKGTTQQKKSFGHSRHRRHRRPGEINMGVKHRIRKPKYAKYRDSKLNVVDGNYKMKRAGNSSVESMNSSQDDVTAIFTDKVDKFDPFTKEKQTIDKLLSQWDDDDEEDEYSVANTSRQEQVQQHIKQSEQLLCFNKALIQDENPLYNPVQAIPVQMNYNVQENQGLLTNLEEKTNQMNVQEPTNQTLIPVDAHSGFLVVDNQIEVQQEEVIDLDAIESELKMLDNQIKVIAEQNNINADVLLSTEATGVPVSDVSPAISVKSEKLFPIFSNPSTGLENKSQDAIIDKTSVSGHHVRSVLKSCDNQYVIDAGQKRFGATQCTECGVIYQIGDPEDENQHLMYHNAVDVLRYHGWKDDNIVGNWGTAKCVMIRGTDVNKWKKVDALLERVVNMQLGYSVHIVDKYRYTAYLYVDRRQILGCLIVEPKLKAHKYIPGDVDCCSVQHYPVKCGISRIWTHTSHRRQSIATKLLDSMRRTFLFGNILSINDIAFSSPTPDGCTFATRYTKDVNFCVYID